MKKLFIVCTVSWLMMAMNSFADSLTTEERRMAEVMKEKGVLPHDVNIEQLDSKYIKYFQYALKENYGIDDITKIGDPDPIFSSPEKTWNLYVQAMIEGDFSLLQRCHTSPKSKKVEMYNVLGKEKVKQIALEMKQFEQISGDDKKAKYRIKRNISGNDLTFYIYFVKLFGEWKVDDF